MTTNKHDSPTNAHTAQRDANCPPNTQNAGYKPTEAQSACSPQASNMKQNAGQCQTTSTPKADENRDAITGQPGAHPVGVGMGAAGGGAAGALAGGVVAGPIGAIAGAVIGATAGGYAGKGAAEAFDPTSEHAYWRGEYPNRPYAAKGSTYEKYAPAYQYGWESYSSSEQSAKSFDEVEPTLRQGWERRTENKALSWEEAKAASSDAWKRRQENGRRGTM